jgi:hypothetical protein
MQTLMMQKVNEPPKVAINPFLIRLHCLKKIHFQQILIYLFGLDFVSRVMELPLSLIYPTVSYGDEWIVTLYILF